VVGRDSSPAAASQAAPRAVQASVGPVALCVSGAWSTASRSIAVPAQLLPAGFAACSGIGSN
jgi:hypothetical protein